MIFLHTPYSTPTKSKSQQQPPHTHTPQPPSFKCRNLAQKSKALALALTSERPSPWYKKPGFHDAVTMRSNAHNFVILAWGTTSSHQPSHAGLPILCTKNCRILKISGPDCPNSPLPVCCICKFTHITCTTYTSKFDSIHYCYI